MTTLKEEEPYAAAVDNEVISLTCSKCFAWNTEELERVKLNRCAGCHVLYYCNAKCQKADWKDHKLECKLLHSANFVPSQDARLIMRMMEKSKKQPEFKSFNGRTYDSLMHHSAKRRENPECMTEARAIYAEISRFMGSKAPNFVSVFLALSKKVINAFKIHDSTWACTPIGTGVYLGLSVLDHSCRPDAFIINQGSKMMLRTTKEGCVYSDKLTISYDESNFFMETSLRRDKLLASYCFLCQCDDCKDIESNEERTSGRPVCCPNSWFSTADRICRNCNKKVSSELADKAKVAMEALRYASCVCDKGMRERRDLSALVPEWMKVFDSCKEILSDESTLLFNMANNICTLITDLNVACKYADLCLPLARKNPHCVFSCILLTRRQQFYEMAKKPLQETKEALNEAIDYVQMIFGPEHDLTLWLLEKKMFYKFANLSTR